jgi:hypothetical protein
MNYFYFLSALNTGRLFSILSDRCLFISSNISFKADTVITNISGNNMVGYPPVIDIDGIV